ncbi:OSCP/delta subunit of ATPase [Lipomyces chichibuensis]|uniref:OSCP/delta subunit of ATPase n=1 Tax=Lipomyces chichibuensis TaxID=1546026 RepID=UPI0033432CAD
MIPARTIFRALPVSGRTFMRTYATAASTAPPVQLFGVDGTYASALYTAAAKNSSLDATSKALTYLKTLLDKDADISGILSNPALSASDKKIVVETLSKSVSVPTVANLLAVLAENNRLGLLSEVIEKFGTLMSAYNGEVEATITSAAPLDSKILSRIESAISKSQFVGAGKKLKVSNKVNPDILGGLIVEVGDRTVDLSVSSKISRLNALINEAV